MDIIWLINASTSEGKDYDVDELTRMWQLITEVATINANIIPAIHPWREAAPTVWIKEVLIHQI